MLGLMLRDEFRGRRLKGTTIDFTNTAKTGALEKPAAEFLDITYPSNDLLKALEAVKPGNSRPVVLIGDRGLGKSHLMATLYHTFTDASATTNWLHEWGNRLNDDNISNMPVRSDLHVIAESLQQQRFKFLWDLILDRHPEGNYIRGLWDGLGEKKTDMPNYDLLLEMFKRKPTAILLDEFQTWFDGLTNTKQFPWRNWAFNFIQILSEIAQNNPDLLVLVVSVRNGNSDAYQQIHRVNPVIIDFKGPYAKIDRKRLLLHRLFVNRMQISQEQIEGIIMVHLNEYFRLMNIPEADQAMKRAEFIESWPYAPHLLQLLEDQVLVATEAQETRDLIKILADLYKRHNENTSVLTAGHFRLDDEKSGLGALLDSVASTHHKTLREKAERNLEAVLTSMGDSRQIPHAAEIVGALWLRSLAVDRLKGAEPRELQVDITGARTVDDNFFQAELAAIVDHSFNIFEVGSRLMFKEEENPQSKLLSHARNDRLFRDGSDVERLAKEIGYIIGGSEDIPKSYRVIVLRKSWRTKPWEGIDESNQPSAWGDNRIPIIVIPEAPEDINKTLGQWLSVHLQKKRNTIRFLLPRDGVNGIYYDREIIVLSRAVLKAQEWKESEPDYGSYYNKYRKELQNKLKDLFGRFALLDIWNFVDSNQCKFSVERHNSQGSQILSAIEVFIRQNVFIQEDFEDLVITYADQGGSVGKLLEELQEPRPGGIECIPWLGETDMKEKIVRICADGRIAIDIRGMELLQIKMGESPEEAWHRMKGKLGVGKHLYETYIRKPNIVSATGEAVTPNSTSVNVNEADQSGLYSQSLNQHQSTITDQSSRGDLTNLGGTNTGSSLWKDSGSEESIILSADPTSSLNLLGKVESWGIGPATNVKCVELSIKSMTGAQLQKLLKVLPDGVIYGLNVEKED